MILPRLEHVEMMDELKLMTFKPPEKMKSEGDLYSGCETFCRISMNFQIMDVETGYSFTVPWAGGWPELR